MPHEPSKDPSTRSAAYERMAPTWAKVQTLLDGTDAMRAAGRTYLPQHENESARGYDERLQSANLFNATRMTLESWVGRPFSDPVEISEEVDDELRAWLDDVDMQGDSIHVFAREWFREGMAKGLSHVLVDFPDIGDAEGRTLADDRAEGARPYMTHIKPENLIFAEAEVVQGREVLTHVRILEEETVRVGFSEQVVTRIRVFDRVPTEGGSAVLVSVWRHHPKAKDKWQLEQTPREIGSREITLVTFYSDRAGFMRSKPPIEDLADLNIRWWQSNSDQVNVLTVARFPLLSATGVNLEQDVLEIGPKRLLAATNERAMFRYVEHTGAAIGAGRTDLKDLEEQMAQYGADFLRKRSGSVTATARALDSAEATSPLQDAVMRFNDALAQAMAHMGAWAGREVPHGAVQVAVDFGPETIVDGDLDALAAARKGRDISRAQYLAELRRRGALADDFDLEQNEKELEEEAASFGGEPSDGEDIDPLAEE